MQKTIISRIATDFKSHPIKMTVKVLILLYLIKFLLWDVWAIPTHTVRGEELTPNETIELTNGMDGVYIYDVPEEVNVQELMQKQENKELQVNLLETVVGGGSVECQKNSGARKYCMILNVTTSGGTVLGACEYDYHYTIDSDYKNIHRRHVNGYYVTREGVLNTVLTQFKTLPIGIADSQTHKYESSTIPEITATWTIEAETGIKIGNIGLSALNAYHWGAVVALKAGTHTLREAWTISH